MGGFSLIEVTIATLLLSVAAVGMLPLFTRAISDNLAGHEATLAAGHARSTMETLLQLPFDHKSLEITDGLERVWTERQDEGRPRQAGDERWVPLLDDEATVSRWNREISLRQFQIHGLVDSDGDGIIDRVLGLEDGDKDGRFDDPLDSESSATLIHLKEVRVRIVTGRRLGALRRQPPLSLSFLRAF